MTGADSTPKSAPLLLSGCTAHEMALKARKKQSIVEFRTGAALDNPTLLSVIMPVYNEEKYLARSLESVLFQNVSFNYEIIIIDDGSFDNTVNIAREYQRNFSNIIVLENEINRGKGYSFKRGYDASKGTYFQVLDGDDLIISWDKLQKQIDFLESNLDYVAVGHNSLILNKDRSISFVVPSFEEKTISYQDCMNNRFYAHTSALLYRKIHDQLPDYFDSPELRGDSAVFFYHVFHSKKKVKYFPDIMSIYNYTEQGIWTGVDDEKKYALIKAYFRSLLDNVIENPELFEYTSVKNIVERIDRKGEYKSVRDIISLERLLVWSIRSASEIYSDPLREQAFRGMHHLKLVDQVCEAVGRLILFDREHLLKDRKYNDDAVAILVSGLRPTGGGVYSELQDLIQLLVENGKKIHIFSTNVVETDIEAFKNSFGDEVSSFWVSDSRKPKVKQVESLLDMLTALAPGRIYPFPSHHDCIMSAAIQRGVGGKVVFDFVFDHGLSLGLTNSSIDKIIVKTSSQFDSLQAGLPPRDIILVPPFVRDTHGANKYKPLQNGNIRTASASARSYKVESDYSWSYADIIPHVLNITKGTHIHYGPLSDTYRAIIDDNLHRLGLPKDRFIHIEWADHLSGSMLEEGVDLFIAPFPIASARTVIQVQSAGIPVLNHAIQQSTLPQSSDFTGPEQLSWRTPNELYDIMGSLNGKILRQKSKAARDHFMRNNEFSVAATNYFSETGISYQANLSNSVKICDLSSTQLFKLDWPRLISGEPKVTAAKLSAPARIMPPVVATEVRTEVVPPISTEVVPSISTEVVSSTPTVVASVGRFVRIFRFKFRIRTRIRRAVAAFLH
ncbi:glycosyltransferase family 2 protein [Brucella tritici]|uniref:glycosyltransferase family 2 protein n=1 Tax=Brucella tritici TaxID=94626 RepID=UPI002000CBD1|nr:glycosyltransferase family 2 protein [Brucella tritici]